MTLAEVSERLARIEAIEPIGAKQFAAHQEKQDDRNTAQWRAIGGTIAVLAGLVVWAISAGFDPSSILHVAG